MTGLADASGSVTGPGSVNAPDGAFWIGSEHPFDLAECYLNFRVDLKLGKAPKQALLHLTADSRYRLWINGTFIGRGPERSWPSSMAVDARDVAGHLQPGRNRIAVQVYSPGYSHFAHVHRAACGLIGWLKVDGETRLVSNRDWRVKRDTSWSAMVPRVSIYGTGVEMRSMALAADWAEADAAGWAPARIVQPPNGPIWSALRPRTTPLLTEEVRPLSLPLETRFGPTPPPSSPDDPHASLRHTYAACPRADIPAALPAGHTAIWVFDLGESRVCLAGARITAATGDMLTISYAEKLQGDAVLLPDPGTYCRMRPTDRTTLRDGRQEIEGFSIRGGRYLIFQLDMAREGTPAPEFQVRLPSYPLEQRALPDLADPTLNATAELCRRTTLACLQDGFVDSVWRESSMWLGDVVAQSFALAALSDDARPLRLAIDLAAEGVAADGILPSVLPSDVPAYVITDYNFTWVELLDFWTRHPGRDDGTLLRRHWPVLCRMLDRFAADLGDDGLIRSQPGRRLFLDWSAQDRSEPNLTYNLRFLHALQLAAELGTILDAPEVPVWLDRAATLRAAIGSNFPRGGDWQESPGGAAASQLALAFLILTGLATGPEAMADAITARSVDLKDEPEPGKLILASPFMHHYVFQALHKLGRKDDISHIIALRWGRWAKAGYPTTWENWSIDFPDGSACHGFSSHPLGWLMASGSSSQKNANQASTAEPHEATRH